MTPDRAIPCPLSCSGASCELLPAGPARLDQSGNTYLPAVRYRRQDCPLLAETFRATGEGWRARA